MKRRARTCQNYLPLAGKTAKKFSKDEKRMVRMRTGQNLPELPSPMRGLRQRKGDSIFGWLYPRSKKHKTSSDPPLVDGGGSGQRVCNLTEVFQASLASMRGSENPLYRQWSCLCLGKLWDKFPDAKWECICLPLDSVLNVSEHQPTIPQTSSLGFPEALCRATADAVPEIRASWEFSI